MSTQKNILKKHSQILTMGIRLMDVAIIFLSGWIAFFIRFQQTNLSFHYFVAMVIGVVFSIFAFSFFELYSGLREVIFYEHFMRLLQSMITLILLFAAFAFLSKRGETYSRLWFGVWMVCAFLLLIMMRCIVFYFLRFMQKNGLNVRRIVIFGASHLGARVATSIQQSLWSGVHIVSFVDQNAIQENINGVPILNVPSDFSQYLTDQNIHEIWFALPLHEDERLKAMMYELRHHTICIRIIVDIMGLDLLNHSLTEMAGFPVLTVRSTPMIGMNRLLKELEDKLLAVMILTMISPLFLLIAIGVKLSSNGPVFFKQYRHGFDGRIIKIYKFRTMRVHEEESWVKQATSRDERITTFGKFLRKTSLDELPQFINVLQGRMSIVGPRPHAVSHNEFYKDAIHTYMQRHCVKPGITGWAQVNGWRGETDTVMKMQKRIEYDLYYINHWSIKFDLKIILLTFFRGFIHRNAY